MAWSNSSKGNKKDNSIQGFAPAACRAIPTHVKRQMDKLKSIPLDGVSCDMQELSEQLRLKNRLPAQE